MKRGSYVVIQADNLTGKGFTPLAWDLAQIISEVFRFERETVIASPSVQSQAYDHTYCFTFKKT